MRRALIIGSSIALAVSLPLALGCGLGFLFFPMMYSPLLMQLLLMPILMGLMGCGGCCFYSPWRSPWGFYSYGMSPWRMHPGFGVTGAIMLSALFLPLPFMMIGFGAPLIAAIVIGSIAAAITVAALVGLTVGLCMRSERDATPAIAPHYAHPSPRYPAAGDSSYLAGEGYAPLYYPPGSYSGYPTDLLYASPEFYPPGY